MANAIELKDFSVSEPIENKMLYKKLQDINVIVLDTSICDVVSNKKDIEPIIEIRKSDEENKVIITTFGYVGKFSTFKVEFNISYRFGTMLLDRMVGKVNDFEMKSLDIEAASNNKKNENDNLVMRMLYMHFILKLEKLSILGLPKSYVRVEHHDKFRGQIDINRYIKKDVPFQGKISSRSYEQEYVQEIVDVLYTALNVVEGYFKGFVTQRVFQTRNLLNHYANRRLVDEETISRAIRHKVLQNSLYSEFKDTLEIASYIIRHSFNITQKNYKLMKGLIFDVSLLWEAYLYKLLKDNFENDVWQVIHEEPLEVYKDKFYIRNMYPDIVLKNENEKKVIVFDAKSKRMKFVKRNSFGAGDLDRSDFFQMNTYMSYYQNCSYKVIAGGLLYPMEGEFKTDECYSKKWFDNDKTQFIVDGIDLSKEVLTIDDIKESENAFVERIKKLSGDIEP